MRRLSPCWPDAAPPGGAISSFLIAHRWPNAAPPGGATGLLHIAHTVSLHRLAKDLANDLFDRRLGDVDIGHR